jgi:alkylated DNA nucleotide flippase Atl1
MNVISLFLKEKRGQRVTPCDRLILKRGYGIIGDANAAVGSPRQVLLVGSPALAQFCLEPGQLQENILIDVQVEQFTSGQVLQLGETALIRLTYLCEPCARLEKVRPGLSRAIDGWRGMLGLVVRDGEIWVGDRICLANYVFPPLPETIRGKFEEFVCHIPQGKVVSTADVIKALGLASSYFRSIPIFLKKSSSTAPVHRIVSTDGRLLTRHMPDQVERLINEGIEIVSDRVSQVYFWDPIYFHDLRLIIPARAGSTEV